MSITKKDIFFFSSVRKDWYYSNEYIPRKIKSVINNKNKLIFDGFPRHWIPLFEWFGIKWQNCISPEFYIPFFSDLSDKEINLLVNNAQKNNSLRILIESTSMFDPVLVDCLYHLDNTLMTNDNLRKKDYEEIKSSLSEKKLKRLILTGWQSYNRPSVKDIEDEILKVQNNKKISVILPCTVVRPYDKSQKHKKIYRIIENEGYVISNVHRIVITSLGIIPEELWFLPQVLSYDARVPDIYRLIRISRLYFSKNKYDKVIDCQNFVPFSDILSIVHREGYIQNLDKIKIPGRSHFYIREKYK